MVLIGVFLVGAPPAAAAPRTVDLEISEEGTEYAQWRVRVPIPAGWKLHQEQGVPLIAFTRRYAGQCALHVNLYAEPAPGSFPLKRVLRKADDVERNTRSTAASNGVPFAVKSWIGKIGGLAFGGGATGPGGFAQVRFTPRPTDDAPKLVLTAQGGTDGACFDIKLDRAPGMVVRALRPVAADSTLHHTD